MALPSDLGTALDALTAARSARDLVLAHQAVRQSIRWQRTSKSPLVASFMAALEILDSQKADGVASDERLESFGKTIRAAWPQVREWKYLCNDCDDTGLMIRTCDGHPRCGCHEKNKPHLPHEYGIPCHCSHGARFRPKPKQASDFTEAAKGFTKVGRK